MTTQIFYRVLLYKRYYTNVIFIILGAAKSSVPNSIVRMRSPLKVPGLSTQSSRVYPQFSTQSARQLSTGLLWPSSRAFPQALFHDQISVSLNALTKKLSCFFSLNSFIACSIAASTISDFVIFFFVKLLISTCTLSKASIREEEM